MGYSYRDFNSRIELIVFLNSEKIKKENILVINFQSDSRVELIYLKEWEG